MNKIQLRRGSGLVGLLAVALSLISGSESLADAPAFEQQRGKRELIAQVLSKRTFEQTHPPKAFCPAFLDDLSTFRSELYEVKLSNDHVKWFPMTPVDF